MKGLTDSVGAAIAAFLALPVVDLSIRLAVGYLVILWLASAWWVFRDMHRRAGEPVSPYLAAGAVLLLTPVGFLLGLLVYTIVRPRTTVAERDLAQLQHLLLLEDARRERCAACHVPVEEEWIRCPSCRAQLAERCGACGQRVRLEWEICAWCAADLPGDASLAGQGTVAGVEVPVQRPAVAAAAAVPTSRQPAPIPVGLDDVPGLPARVRRPWVPVMAPLGDPALDPAPADWAGAAGPGPANGWTTDQGPEADGSASAGGEGAVGTVAAALEAAARAVVEGVRHVQEAAAVPDMEPVPWATGVAADDDGGTEIRLPVPGSYGPQVPDTRTPHDPGGDRTVRR